MKRIPCIDCPSVAVMSIAGFPVGFCELCSKKALAAALFQKMTRPAKRKKRKKRIVLAKGDGEK